MSESQRPVLKLKLPKAMASTAPPVPTPTGKKLTIKFSKSASENEMAGDRSKPFPTPTASSAKGLKLTFKKKPTSLAGMKREHEGDQNAPTSAGPKRLKLTNKTKSTPITPKTPLIKLKAKGKPPKRPMGIGYDSEASDAEQDPHIEEEFILRMQPGDDCDYVRNAIEKKLIGTAEADIRLKFLRQDGRRATLTVRKNMYAASMVDLPCIIEGMKSWDKKGWWKTADICQMLLVLGRVKTEEEAQSMPLPKGDVREGTFMYEHGLTPPMKWVRKRRFRKRVSTNIVMQVEQAVEDLFKRDAEAISSDYKIQTLEEINEERLREQREAEDLAAYFDDDQDANGEYEDDVQDDMELGEEDAEGDGAGVDWENMWEEDEVERQASESQAPTPATQIEAQPENADSDTATPIVSTAVAEADEEAETPAGQDVGDDSGSDADEDDAEEDVGEAELADQQHRDEIAELQSTLDEKVAALATIRNPLLKKRQDAIIKSLNEQLAVKKSALGLNEYDD